MPEFKRLLIQVLFVFFFFFVFGLQSQLTIHWKIKKKGEFLLRFAKVSRKKAAVEPYKRRKEQMNKNSPGEAYVLKSSSCLVTSSFARSFLLHLRICIEVSMTLFFIDYSVFVACNFNDN